MSKKFIVGWSLIIFAATLYLVDYGFRFYHRHQILKLDKRFFIYDNIGNVYLFRQEKYIDGHPCDITIILIEDIQQHFTFMVNWNEKEENWKFGTPKPGSDSTRFFNFYLQGTPNDYFVPLRAEKSNFRKDQVWYKFLSDKLLIKSYLFKKHNEIKIGYF